MANWQVLQLSRNENFYHEADTREAALVLFLSRPEEGIACSIFPKEALFRKAYFAEISDIDVQPSLLPGNEY